MKRIFLFSLLIAMVFSFQETHSQSLRSRLRDKILNDNLEAQAKRDSIKAVEEGREPDKTPNTTMDRVYMDALGLTGNVDYEPTYHFDAYIQMQITNYKKNGTVDDEMIYDSYVHKDNADYAMEFKNDDGRSTIIFDTKNSAMLILGESDGEKTGFATSIDPEAMAASAEDYAEDHDIDPVNYRKTGKTKMILGYSCDEYLVEDEDSESHIWISEKLGKEIRKEWLNNQQTFGTLFTQAYALNGVALEYDFLDKGNGKKSEMIMTKIDLNHSHSVSTAGYDIISMRQKTEDE
jgi:hypothetical protein